MLKIVGVIVGVFVAWSIGAFIVGMQLHIGQTYDPNFGGVGAWFVDPAKQHEAAVWNGGAVFWGIVVALGSGVLYWVKLRFDRLGRQK